MKIGTRVKLKSFTHKIRADTQVDDKENYWKLIGKIGFVVQDPSQKSIYADFSEKQRVLIQFSDDLDELNLNNHNLVPNSLWILVDDLEINDTDK